MHFFIDAETFDSIGGWTVDTQCIEAMGSCYLLAHGVGRPVADAVTTITLPDSRNPWSVFVRTRDWTAVWKRGTSAGRFQLLVDEVPLPQELGTNGENWAWQVAGSTSLSKGQHTLALHDLTGFDGRCDAVYLTDDPADVPPNEQESLAEFRRKCCGTVIEDDPIVYDLIVCGGGFAGLCAGYAAKKSNLKFKIIQDRPVVGGCASSEVRVWVGGLVNLGQYPNLGNIASVLSPVNGIPGMKKDPELFEDDRKRLLFRPEDELLLSEVVLRVEMDPCQKDRIAAVITRSVRTGKETRRRARLFADCTGDAMLARQSGCETMYGCEGRNEFHENTAPDQPEKLVMGHSTLWETRVRDQEVRFPDIDWGLEFTDDNALTRLDCCWDWETGQYRDQVKEIEYIRDYGLMTCYANWSFLKNRSAQKEKWRNMELEWLSPIGGKRESYRVKGDLILTQNDIMNKVPYPDATGDITWSIDLHFPDPENKEKFGEAFQSCAYHLGIQSPYPVPYRCLYAKDVRNLFLGGRCLSVTHVAFSCIRVMRTLGMLGEVIGMAAAVCRAHDCDPRSVYSDFFDELRERMSAGIPRPQPHGYMPGEGESYHFMRPVGTYGNSTENCWLMFDRDSKPRQEIPQKLGQCIKALGLRHNDGKKYHQE